MYIIRRKNTVDQRRQDAQCGSRLRIDGQDDQLGYSGGHFSRRGLLAPLWG